MRQHVETFGPWAIDNDCFSRGHSFDATAWYEWLNTLDRTALFATAPDVVGDPMATWKRSAPWLERIRDLGHSAALVAQDGIELAPIEWDTFDALFIGGSTEWKLSSAAVRLCWRATANGKHVHIGRVNSKKRYQWARDVARADTADGTYLRFGPTVNVPKMMRWFE
jgi:hypothetical protein